MSVLSKEKFFELIKSRIGEDTSDESIRFLEDVTDTYNDLETRSGEDWKRKYMDNDTMWRKKYTERFYSPEPDTSDVDVDKVTTDTSKPETFEDLFEVKEDK